MKKINVDDLPWDVWASPKGKFSSKFKQLSIALGAVPDAPVGAGGHPFDLSIETLGPGETSCPYHEHLSQWESFYILSGSGTVRADGIRHEVRAGDAILHPPGDAHQITNTGGEDLKYLIVADNPSLDVCRFPDSGKMSISGSKFRSVFRANEVDYFDGEE